MAEAQRLIGISLAKIAQSRVCRGGVSLHKNLLVATVLQKARYIFMEEAYHIVHGHYLQQQQQQQHHHQQLMQEQQHAAYLLAGHCDGSPAEDGGCDDDCSNNNNNNNSKCSSGLEEEEEKQQQQQQLLAARCSPVEELVDPVEEEEDGATTTLSYDCDTTNTTTTTILPTTIGSLGPLEPLNMCRNNGSPSAAAAPAGDTHEQPDEEEEEEEKQTSTCQDVAAHLFLLPALAPWIGAPEDNKENIGSSFSFLPAAASPFHYHHDEEEEEQEEDDEEEEEEENTCQDLSCHRRKQEAADHQPELARKQLESAVRSKGALRYFDLDDRRTARHERRRRRHRTEGDDEQQAFPSVPAKRRRSSDWDRTTVELPDQQSTNDDRIHPIPLLSAKRLKTIDNQQQQQQPRPLTPALCPQPQFYSSPHETICPGDAETLSACVNQQLEAENLSTSGGGSSNTSPPLAVEEPEVEQQQQHPEETDAAAPAPAPSVESIDRITSLVSIFSFGNLSRSVSTPDVFCAAQAQKDARPDAGGSLLTSQLQHHGQRGYLTMTV